MNEKDTSSVSTNFMQNILSEAINGELKTLNSMDIASIKDDATRNFMHELKKELTKVIKDRERVLNKRYPLGPSEKGIALSVEDRLIKRFEDKGYGRHLIHCARKLWQDFVKSYSFPIKGEDEWVAAIDYLAINSGAIMFREDRRIRQKDIADEYGITFNRFSTCYRAIRKTIDTSVYFTHGDTIDNIYHIMKTILKISKKFVDADKEMSKRMEEGEEFLENIYLFRMLFLKDKKFTG